MSAMSEASSVAGGTARQFAPSRGRQAFPWWLYGIVGLGAALLLIGAGVALFHPQLLVSPHDAITGAVQIYAGYLASRNLALAALLLVALFLRARSTLNAFLLLLGLIQLLDAVIDCTEARWAVAPGVFFLGILFLVAAARFSGYAFWHRQSWRPDA